MNISAIRSLLLAAELGSFAAAGEQLRVPPSTISRRISELENDLGQKILIRTGRGVRVAEEAGGTLIRLRDVLFAVDACYSPPSPMPRIRVTAPVEMSMSLLPRVLPEFGTQFPDVFVEINGLNRNLGLIEEGFDLAIRAGALVDSSYLSRKLPSDRFRLVAAPKMAAGIQSAAQLAVTPCVEVAGPPPELSGYWNGERFSVRSPAVAKLDSFTAALPLVLSGKAYAVMPKHVAGDYLADGKLHELTAVRLDEITLHALYPRRHRKQPALSTFIDMVAVLLDRQSG